MATQFDELDRAAPDVRVPVPEPDPASESSRNSGINAHELQRADRDSELVQFVEEEGLLWRLKSAWDLVIELRIEKFGNKLRGKKKRPSDESIAKELANERQKLKGDFENRVFAFVCSVLKAEAQKQLVRRVLDDRSSLELMFCKHNEHPRSGIPLRLENDREEKRGYKKTSENAFNKRIHDAANRIAADSRDLANILRKASAISFFGLILLQARTALAAVHGAAKKKPLLTTAVMGSFGTAVGLAVVALTANVNSEIRMPVIGEFGNPFDEVIQTLADERPPLALPPFAPQPFFPKPSQPRDSRIKLNDEDELYTRMFSLETHSVFRAVSTAAYLQRTSDGLFLGNYRSIGASAGLGRHCDDFALRCQYARLGDAVALECACASGSEKYIFMGMVVEEEECGILSGLTWGSLAVMRREVAMGASGVLGGALDCPLMANPETLFPSGRGIKWMDFNAYASYLDICEGAGESFSACGNNWALNKPVNDDLNWDQRKVVGQAELRDWWAAAELSPRNRRRRPAPVTRGEELEQFNESDSKR